MDRPLPMPESVTAAHLILCADVVQSKLLEHDRIGKWLIYQLTELAPSTTSYCHIGRYYIKRAIRLLLIPAGCSLWWV